MAESDIPIRQIEELSAKAMDDNIRVLQALAANDRRDFNRPWEAGKFVIDLRREFTATVGTISGFIPETVTSMNFPTSEYLRVPPVGKVQSVST